MVIVLRELGVWNWCVKDLGTTVTDHRRLFVCRQFDK